MGRVAVKSEPRETVSGSVKVENWAKELELTKEAMTGVGLVAKLAAAKEAERAMAWAARWAAGSGAVKGQSLGEGKEEVLAATLESFVKEPPL